VALYLNPVRGARGIFSGRPGATFENYRRITSDPSEGTLEQWVYALDWSPNGASMLFAGTLLCVDSTDPACPFEGEESDIYRVFMKGGLKPRRLTRDGGSESPVFSPDGTRMAFEDVIRGGIAVRRLAGGNTRLVGKGGSSPAWQPVTRATLFR
jgi:Tol biopolymer transport system component